MSKGRPRQTPIGVIAGRAWDHRPSVGELLGDMELTLENGDLDPQQMVEIVREQCHAAIEAAEVTQ